MKFCQPLGMVVILVALVVSATSNAQQKGAPEKAGNPAAVALIDKLANLTQFNTGGNPFVSGTAFVPLSGHSRVNYYGAFPKARARSETFRELVKLGPAAVPDLVAHLSDKRPTQMTFMPFGQLLFDKPDKDDKPDTYTVKVGDLCYVALGQIVNRDYGFVTSFPSTESFLHTPTRDPQMREELKKEWGELTPDKHRRSLLKDCEGEGIVRTRTGAFMRLGWYYPDALEAPALQFLARTAGDERESIPINHFVEVIEYGLTYDRRPKIDKAMLELLLKSNEERIVTACLKRLVGRGFDTQIEAYFRRREKELDKYGLQTLKNFQQQLGWTPLHVAVSRGQAERLTELLREGAKVNAAAKDGSTPLHIATVEEDAQIVKFLLDAGADQKATDKRGKTPVSVASFEGNTIIVLQLVAAGGPISDIFVAATVGKTEAVAEFLRKDKTLVGATDSADFRPLHRAAAEGQLKVMQQLLDAGADVSLTGVGRMTALDVAAALGRADACALLIKGKAKIDGPGIQPIHRAAMEGHVDVVKLLVEKGAKVDARDDRMRTPLHCAAGGGHLEVVKWLVEHKADVHAKDDAGKNVLYHAIVNKTLENEVAEYLRMLGAKSKSD